MEKLIRYYIISRQSLLAALFWGVVSLFNNEQFSELIDFTLNLNEYEASKIWLIEFFTAYFIWLLVESYMGFKSGKLLYKYYLLNEDSSPLNSTFKQVKKCLWLGNYQYVWQATRVSIECKLWSSKEKEFAEKEFIENYLKRFRTDLESKLMETGDDINNVPNCFVLTDSNKRKLISSYFESIQDINPKDDLRDRFLTDKKAAHFHMSHPVLASFDSQQSNNYLHVNINHYRCCFKYSTNTSLIGLPFASCLTDAQLATAYGLLADSRLPLAKRILLIRCPTTAEGSQ